MHQHHTPDHGDQSQTSSAGLTMEAGQAKGHAPNQRGKARSGKARLTMAAGHEPVQDARPCWRAINQYSTPDHGGRPCTTTARGTMEAGHAPLQHPPGQHAQ